MTCTSRQLTDTLPIPSFNLLHPVPRVLITPSTTPCPIFRPIDRNPRYSAIVTHFEGTPSCLPDSDRVRAVVIPPFVPASRYVTNLIMVITIFK